MKALRDEILQNQRQQWILENWKVVLCSGLATAGLGVGAAQNLRYAYLLLAVVPLVCLYVDALSYQASLRVFVIANFMRTYTRDGLVDPEDIQLQHYEVFLHNARRTRMRRLFSFGRLSRRGASIAFSLLPLLGVVFVVDDLLKQEISKWAGWFMIVLLAGSTVTGNLLHWLFHSLYYQQLTEMEWLIDPISRVIGSTAPDPSIQNCSRELVELIRRVHERKPNITSAMELRLESLSWLSADGNTLSPEGCELAKQRFERIAEEHGIRSDNASN